MTTQKTRSDNGTMTKVYNKDLGITILAFDCPIERDAYETYVTKFNGKSWTDKGFDSDSMLYWLY